MNDHRWSVFAWCGVIFFVQVGLSSFISWHTPPLVLISLVYFSLLRGPFFAFFLGIYLGLLTDVFSSQLFGLSAIIYAFEGVVFGLLSSKLFRDSLLTQILSTCAGQYATVFATLLCLQGQMDVASGREVNIFLRAFLMSNLWITAATAPILFRFLEKRFVSETKRARSWP